MNPPSPPNFEVLFHHRWGVPIVAELHARRGCRFAELAGRLGVSRDVLSQTLEWLVVHGLVARNPGYGHPMRPEYLATRMGDRVGPMCVRLSGLARRLRAEDVLFRRWSCAVLYEVAGGHTRFGELRAALPGVTPRALSQCLLLLEETGLVSRTVSEGRPPRVEYAVTMKGRRVARALGDFALVAL